MARGKGRNDLKYPTRGPLGWLSVICLATGVLAASCAQREPKLIPTTVLLGNPVKTLPAVSPDARRLSYLAPYNGVLNVWVRTIGAGDDRAVTHDADRGIEKYFWAYDNRHILYFQDLKGDDNWRLYGIDVDTGENRDFTPFDSMWVGIVDYSKRFPHDIIVTMNHAGAKAANAYRLNLETGTLTMIAKNPGTVQRWFADPDFAIRAALASRPEGGYDLIVRKDASAPWRRLLTWSTEDIASSGVLKFTRDGSGLYCLDARGYNTGRLVKVAIADSSVDVIAQDPKSEIMSAFFQVDTYRMQAVAYAREHIEWSILDESLRPDLEAAERLDRGDMEFESTDASDSTWVVSFRKDTNAASYYLYDRRTKRGSFLFDEIPDLKSYALAPMEPLTLTARDGLEIHGYLTYPPGKKHRNLPLVVHVHAGPWQRDYWGYDPEVQLLANRGYACMQVNYRGSRGYGKDFTNAGNKEWGGKMQDDLVDAVKWAVARGIANPKKVAVFGVAGYGGYAALHALATTNDLFRCGVDISGPCDLLGWVNAVTPYWGPASTTLFKRVGDPRTDADFLRSRSPLFQAAKIRSPLLVAHGSLDPYVPTSDVERVVASLKGNGVPCEYLVFSDERSGISKPQNRMKFWAAAETFLAEFLGGRHEQRDIR